MTTRSLVLLAAAVVLLAGCRDAHTPTDAGGIGTATGPADAQEFTVHGNDLDQFTPQTVRAQVGTLNLTLRAGGVPHNLTFTSGGLPGIGVVSGSATKSVRLTLTEPGTYTFLCTIHAGMDGKLVVAPAAGG